jgi:PAS domain S-box-containing protein
MSPADGPDVPRPRAGGARRPLRRLRFSLGLPLVLATPAAGPADSPPNAFRRLFELSTDCEFAVDDSLRIRFCNPAAGGEFQWSEWELAGVAFLELVAPEDRPVVQEAFSNGAEHSRRWSQIPVRGKRRDGALFSAELRLAEWHEGGRHWFAVVVRSLEVSAGEPPKEPAAMSEQLDLRAVLFAQRLKELA